MGKTKKENKPSMHISYNLPGFGFTDCLLFGETENLYNFLDKKGILEKMQNTYHLGTMRFVYPGAHHTRYEYVFTQLMLINNVVTTKRTKRRIEISLGSYLAEYEPLGFQITGGTCLQMLALLSNMGHMYDTFTASRILLRLLISSKKDGTAFYHTYRRNLPKDIHRAFDALIDSENYYKLHLFNAIHLLKGFSNTPANAPLCNLCIKILSQLIDPELIINEATSRIFVLYKKLRKISYLSIDMIYTPASFGANLSQMIYSISSAIDDLFNEQSAVSRSISQLEDIIHKQIYDSPVCILNSTRIEQEYYNAYSEITQAIDNIFDIRKLILEAISPYSELHCKTQPAALKKLQQDYTLLLSGSKIQQHTGRILSYNEEIISTLPSARIAFGTQVAQNLACVYSAFGLLTHDHIIKDSQTIISKAISNKMYNDSEAIELVQFAIGSLYKPNEFYFTLSAPSDIPLGDCVFIGNGCKSIANAIRAKFSSQNVSNADQLHEILSCAKVLDHLTYSGLVLCFVGGIKASMYSKSEKMDELDGFIYFPNRSPKSTFATIVEAKNYPHGETLAEKQLIDTKKYLSSDCSVHIQKMERLAYMEITLP